MRPPKDDPYWDFFINRPPADPNNVIPHAFRGLPQGDANPVRTAVHSPNVMSDQIKELGRFYGADLVGIVELASEPGFAIVSVLKADYDTRMAHGPGGQTPVLKGLFATFTLAAFIRELGYSAATRVSGDDNRGERLAAAAGLGILDGDGRLVIRRHGRGAYVAEVIFTDLPLQPDGQETRV